MKCTNLIHTPNGQWRLYIVCIIAFCVAFFGFIPGMGLPGALLLMATDSVLNVFGGHFGYKGFFYFSHGDDYVWPAAIMMTWALAPMIVLGYLVAFRGLYNRVNWQKWLAFTTVLLVLGIGVTLWMYGSIAS
jgi:hypothetical protein